MGCVVQFVFGLYGYGYIMFIFLFLSHISFLFSRLFLNYGPLQVACLPVWLYDVQLILSRTILVSSLCSWFITRDCLQVLYRKRLLQKTEVIATIVPPYRLYLGSSFMERVKNPQLRTKLLRQTRAFVRIVSTRSHNDGPLP